MKTSMTEKLKLVREAEEKAGGTLAEYREKAEAIIAEARDEVERTKEEMETEARSDGVAEMNEIIEEAGVSASDLGKQYEEDGNKLREAVADRRGAAVAFIVEKLEEGA